MGLATVAPSGSAHGAGTTGVDQAALDAVYVEVAQALIARASDQRKESLRSLIDAVSRGQQVPGSLVSQIFWELVRLRIFSPLGSLRRPEQTT